VAKDKDEGKDADKDADQDEGPLPGLDAGMQVFVWDLRYATLGKGRDAMPGPRVVPGRYRVSLSLGGVSQSREFEVRADPRTTASAADWQASQDLTRQIQLKVGELGQAALRIGALRKVLQQSKAADAPARLALLETLAAKLVSPDFDGYLESLAHPASLESRLGSLMFAVESSLGRPTPADAQVFAALSAQVDEGIAALHAFDDLKLKDVQAFRPGRPVTRLGLQRRDADDD